MIPYVNDLPFFRTMKNLWCKFYSKKTPSVPSGFRVFYHHLTKSSKIQFKQRDCRRHWLFLLSTPFIAALGSFGHKTPSVPSSLGAWRFLRHIVKLG